MVSTRHLVASQPPVRLDKIDLGAALTSHSEILDFGYPQNSEIDTLKMYITTESIKSEMAVVGVASEN